MKKEKRIFGKVLMVLMIAFFYLPIVFMIVFSFNSGRSLTNFEGFSLTWYERMFNNRDMMESLYTTITIASIANGRLHAAGNDQRHRAVQEPQVSAESPSCSSTISRS